MHENNGKPEALLWIDFETTGVDRRKSLPLEIGMECTDMLGEQKFGSLSRIIRPDRLDLLSMSPRRLLHAHRQRPAVRTHGRLRAQ